MQGKQVEIDPVEESNDRVDTDPTPSEPLKIEISKIKRKTLLAPDRVESPAINIIDADFKKWEDVAENEASTQFVPKIDPSQWSENEQDIDDNFSENKASNSDQNSNNEGIVKDVQQDADEYGKYESDANKSLNDAKSSPREVNSTSSKDDEEVSNDDTNSLNSQEQADDEISATEITPIRTPSVPMKPADSEDGPEADLQAEPESDTNLECDEVIEDQNLSQESPNDIENNGSVESFKNDIEVPKDESEGQTTPSSELPTQPDLAETEEQKQVNTSQNLPKHYESMITTAQELKQEGNDYFKKGDLKTARTKYAKVFAYTKAFYSSDPGSGDGMIDLALKSKGVDTMSNQQIAKDLERDVNNNLAVIYLKEQNYTKVIEKTTNSLKIQKNVKSYFNRGKAQALKNDFEAAYADFELGKFEFPEQTKMFDAEIEKTRTREKEYDKETDQKYAGFLN